MGEAHKNERASYAYEISGYDKDFVLTLNAENGAWTENERHGLPYSRCWSWERWNSNLNPTGSMRCEFWRKHYDYGLCGMSDYYKRESVNNPNFSSWKWQVERCHEIYTDAINRGVIKTKFYGYNHRYARGKNVIFNQ